MIKCKKEWNIENKKYYIYSYFCLFFNFYGVYVFAHDFDLGIEWYDDIIYDPCVANNIFDEKWYDIVSVVCPYPYYSLYSWTLTIPSGLTNFDVDIDEYAIVTVNGLGSFSLSGLYYLPNGNTITVNITINIIIRS